MPVSEVDTSGRVPVKIWAADLEPQARAQLANLATLPFLFKHVAVMPDVHWGLGAAVGSVIATQGAVVPAAVGVDIGCDMIAVKTPLDHRRVRDRTREIRRDIERSIPVGFQGNRRIAASAADWEGWGALPQALEKDQALRRKATAQLGSLGGGNHFIEICVDTENNVWAMLHSGSRNVGKTLAERHIAAAKGVMRRFFVDLPDPNLAYLVEGSPEFDAYLADLHWCQAYAMQNRVEMMNRVLKDLAHELNGGEPFERLMWVNCHHNYAETEHHFGRDVIVTRKGAVRARQGDLGIIPGSMGTRSYIVRGKGCADSFHSCSHGAGRRMSRKEAKRRFSEADLAEQTAGVECRKDAGVVDEIPGAYKDIDQVMAAQTDLVEVVAELKQIICVKG